MRFRLSLAACCHLCSSEACRNLQWQGQGEGRLDSLDIIFMQFSRTMHRHFHIKPFTIASQKDFIWSLSCTPSVCEQELITAVLVLEQ